MLRVLQAGLLTTIQDEGRRDALRLGVPRGGAMDRFALAAANRLIGNDPGAAALEITAGGVAFELVRGGLIAVTGGDLGALIDDEPLPQWTALWARRGAIVRLVARRGAWGARAYLVPGGGIDVPRLLGSRSTYLPGGFGGLDGRALREGDRLDAGISRVDAPAIAGRVWHAWARPAYGAQPTIRFVAGPHADRLAPGSSTALESALLTVGAASNRIGYRLDGVRLQHVVAGELHSLGVLTGAIQIPPDGTPIVLMADAQPTGGYPLAGVVIGADLPLLAQLLPGDRLRLRAVTTEHARAAWQAYHRWLLAPPRDDPALDLLRWAGG